MLKTKLFLLPFFCLLFNYAQAACPIAVTPSPATICAGGNTVLTASGAATYVWSPATGLSATTGAAVTASPATSTIYKCVGTCGNGQQDSVYVTVVVKPLPTASFTFTPVVPACANVPIVFTGTSTGTGLTYSWAFGDGNTSTVQNPSHTYTTAVGFGIQNFTVSFTVTSSTGCSKTVTQNVAVKQLPSTAMGGSGAVVINGQPYFKVCTSNPTAVLTFTNTSTTTANNTNYIIDYGDGSPLFTSTSSWGPTLNHTYSIGLYTLIYTVTGANGCTYSTNYNVFVGSNPAVGLGSPGNTDVCGGGTLTFPITNAGNNPPGTTYIVTFGDGTAPVTFNQPPPASVSHTFNVTSCSAGNGGLTSNGGSFPNAFTATITVSNPCGSTAASVTPIYVSSAPVASFLISPSPTICVNSSGAFQNNSVGYDAASGACISGSPAIWSISPASGWTSGSTFGNTFGLTDPNLWLAGSNTLNVNFNTIGTYTITMITGSLHLCGLDTITQTVCIVPPPTPSFNMTPPNGCAPSVITVSNTSLGSAGCSNLGYSWLVSYSSGCIYYGSGSYIYSTGSNSSQNPIFTFSTPGTYTVTLAVSNVCGTFSTSKSTVVKDLPYITTSSVSGACGTSTINPSSYFSVNGCGGTVSTYAWSYPSGTPSTGSTANPGNVTFTTPGSNNIGLVATNECGSTSAAVSAQVYPVPIVNAGPDQTICSVNGVYLNGSASNGTPWYNYSWSPSYSSSCCPLFYPGATTTYTLSVSDWYGCSSSDAVTVTVNLTPTVVAGASPNPICYGQTISLNAAGAATYSWSGLGLNSTTGAAVTATASSSSTYSVTGTSAQGCPDNDNLFVTVYPLPSLSINPSNPNICTGQSVVLNANGANAYTWHPTATLSAASGSSVTATPTVTTTYHLIGTSFQGCIDSITTIVGVNGVPTVSVTAPAGVTCPGQSKTLTASGGTSYSWSPATNLNTTVGNPVIANPTVTTTYVVTGSNGANCQDTAYIVVVVKAIQNLSIIHTDSTVCLRQTNDQITVSGGSGYVWTPALGLNTTTGPTVIATPTVTTQYFVTANNGVGCSITDSTVVTVNPLPPVNAGPNVTICFGTNASIGTAAVAGYTYSWSPIAGLVNPSVAVATASPTVTTTYVLTQTNTITGCFKKDTTIVTVVPLPLAPSLSSNSPVCWYATINLGASGLAGATYNWTGPNGFASGLQNPSVPFAQYPDSGDYYCSQFIGGCNSVPDTIHVSMYHAPPALSGFNSTICAGNSAPIGAPANVGSTYSWTSTPVGYSSTASFDTLAPTVTTTYTITEVDYHGCSDSNNVVITVKPLPVVSFTFPNPACMNAGVLFTNTSTGSLLNRTWHFGDGTSSGIGSPNHAYASTGTFIIELIEYTTTGCIDSLFDTIAIVTIPVDTFGFTPHIGCGPLPVTFTNYSSGYFPTYNWDFGFNAQFFTGQNPPSMTYPSPYHADTTYIVQLVAFNLCGAATRIDSVIVHPSPHTNFGTNVSVGCSPLPIYFSNTTTGLATSYLWDFGDGSPTSTIAQPPPHTYLTGLNDTTYYITLIAYNACGSDTLVDSILVHPNTVNAFMNISSQAGCAPFTTTVSNFSIGANVFSWNFGNGGFSNSPVASVTYPAAGTYTIYLSANNGCSYDTASAVVTVYPVPNVIATPAPQAICSGYSSNISLNSLVPGTNFGWTVAQNGVSGGSAGASAVGISQVLTLTGATPGTAIYTIVPSPSVYGCVGVPFIDTVTVAPSPTVTATPGSRTICEGSNTGINLSGTPAGTTFSWIVAQNNTNGATNAVGNTINQTLFCNTPSVGSTTFTVIPNFNGCAGPSIPVLVNVNPVPVVTATPNSATICTGSAPTITLTSSVANTTYNWTVVQTGISGASAGSGSIISQTLSTTGLVPGNAVYTITPTANNCSGNPIQVTIIVNPYPTATATPSLQTICSGSAPAILLASNVIGTSFSWVVTPNLVAGASNSSGALINQALTTTGNVSGTVLYTVTPDVSGCAGNSILVTVNVNPTPVLTATPVAQTLCAGLATAINLTANVSGTTFAWTVAQSGVSGASNGSGILIAQTLNSTGNTIGSATYTITPTANNCTGTAVLVPVTVNPIPVLTVNPVRQTICSGSPTSINLTSNVAGASFNWVVAQSGVNGSIAGTGNTIAQQLNSITPIIDSVIYTISLSANGCSGNSKSATAIVNPLPVVTASPSNQTICSGNSSLIFLTSNVLNTTYSWTVAQSNVTGASNGIGSTIAQTVTCTGNFPGSVTYTITPLANNCTGLPLTVTLTVNPSPVLNVVVSQSSVCLGQVVNFSFNNPSLSSYFWKFGDGSFSNVNPATHAYTGNGSFTATLIGTSTAYGCTDSSKKVITILSSPVAAISATPTIGCQPLTVSFTNSTPFSSFNQWTYGDGNSSAAYAPTHTYNIAGTFNVKFVSTNASGCTDTAYIPIYVYATPVASFQLSDTFACSPPGVVNVFNTSSNANGFTWSDGNGGTNLNTNATFTYNAASTYTITLTATNPFNCTATASHNYILYPKPVADFLGVPLIGCEPLPVAFTDASQNSVYQHWNFGDNNFAVNNATPNHTYAKAGVYTVTLDIEGINHVCTDSVTKIAYITVLPKPIATFSFDNMNTPEPAVNVNFNSQASINATNYIWNFGDGSALVPTTDFTATHAYSNYGNYTVYLIAQHANGCSDTTNQLIETSYVTGLFVPNAMSPNAGANDEVKVFKPKGLGLASYHVQIFSTWGEKLWESYEIDEHGAPKEAWDGTFKGELMPQDVYVWKIDGVFSNANVWKGNTYDGKKFSQTGTISLLR